MTLGPILGLARSHERAFFFLRDILRLLLPASLMLALLIGPRYAKLRLTTAYALFILILVAGSIPGARQEVGTYASGLILHAGAYSTLAFLVYTGCNAASARACAARALATVAAMGALDELVQGMLSYRRGAVGDWLIDVGAALLTVIVLYFLLPRRR